MTKWKLGLIHWQEDNKVFISVIFSWQLEKAYALAEEYHNQGFETEIGGPAIGGSFLMQ